MSERFVKSAYRGADQAVRMLSECPRSDDASSRTHYHGQTVSSQNSFALLSDIKTPIRTEPFGDRYSLIPGKELGRGKFAMVRKYKERCSGKEYAAKFVRKRRKGQDCCREIIHEIAVLELARECPWVVDLHEVYETASEMILVLEYAAGGEIFDQCVAEREEAFGEEDVKRLMRQILEGVSFLHSRGIVHLDLKPQNILLSRASPLGDVKLVDFGLSRVVSRTRELREITGTPEYVAPEILNFEPISTATDMWSIGVLTFVMLTGLSPFLGKDKQETFLNISQMNISYSDEELMGLDQTAISFMKSLLIKEPKARATAQQCLQHQWLQQREGEEHQEEGQGQATEEIIVVAAYSLGECWQSEPESVTPQQNVISKRFKFEEPFGTLQEIIY